MNKFAAGAHFVGLVFLSSLCVWLFDSNFGWYNQQRFGQLLVAFFASFFLTAKTIEGLVPASAVRLLLAFFLVGLLSSFFSEYQIWALAEVSVWCGLVLLGFFSASVMQRSPERTSRVVVFIVASLSGVLVLRGGGLMALNMASGQAVDFVGSVSVGFSNPRFFGQVFAIFIPLVAAPAAMGMVRGRMYLCLFLLTAAMWLVLLLSGTRGALFGLVVGFLFVIRWVRCEPRWPWFHLFAAGVGVVSWFVVSVALPFIINAQDGGGSIGVLRSGLSGRDRLWLAAVHMALDHPLFGGGPMHLAAHIVGPGSHPHQALLQIIAEWGVTAFIICVVLTWRGLRRVRQLVSGGVDQGFSGAMRIALLYSLVSAIGQSMVDGVLVVPYTQTWLALCVGWLVGLGGGQPTCATQRNWIVVLFFGLICALTFFILFFVQLSGHPIGVGRQLQSSEAAGRSEFLRPRFWEDGAIAP